MVLDHLDNAALYYGLSEPLAAALRYLRDTDFEKMEVGRYELNGDRLYAMVQDYTTRTRDQGIWEAHRKYIDVQYVVRGQERMGVTGHAGLNITKPYDEKIDALLAEGPGDLLALPQKHFVILWPQDAHMPGQADGQPAPVRKVVVKVQVA